MVTNFVGNTSPVWSISQQARAKAGNWDGATLVRRADATFQAFIEEFRARNWKYTAGGAPFNLQHLLGGVSNFQAQVAEFDKLIAGAPKGLDCGRIANMFKIVVDVVVLPGLRGAQPAVTTERIDGFFVTKKLGTPLAGVSGSFACIDSSVVGSVRANNTTYALEKRCLFLDHYALKVGGKIYDACLTSTYADIESIVEAYLEKDSATKPAILRSVAKGKIPKKNLLYQELTNERPQGFSCGYLLF